MGLTDGLQNKRRIKEELRNNPLWTILASKTKWFCPYCAKEAIKRWPRDESEQVEKVHEHLTKSCKVWENWDGAIRSVQELQRQKRLRELLSRVKKSVVKQKEWMFSDNDGRWYCPFCVKRTEVTIPSNRRMDPKILEGMVDHVESCFDFKKTKGEERTLNYVQTVVTKANKQKRLVVEVQALLEADDGLWTKRDKTGAWLCPYCRENLSHIDISSPLLKKQNAPPLIVEHLIRICTAYNDKEKLKTKEDFEEEERKRVLVISAEVVEDEDLDSLAVPESRLHRRRGRRGGAWGRDGEMAARRHGKTTLDELGQSDEAEFIDDELLDMDVDEPQVRRQRRHRRKSWRDDISEELERAHVLLHIKRKERRARERQVSRRIDEGAPLVPFIQGFEVALELQPGTRRQGDFIDVRELGSLVTIAVGSVTTRSDDPVAVGRLTRKLVRLHQKTSKDPAEVLKAVNADLFPDLGPKTFVHLFLALLEPSRGQLVHARAGGFAPLVLRPSAGRRARLRDAEGMVVGVDSGPMFDKTVGTSNIQLEPEDLVVLHTGGIIDTRNSRREPLGVERFENLVDRYGRHEADYLIDKLREKVNVFTRYTPSPSDIAVIALRRLQVNTSALAWKS